MQTKVVRKKCVSDVCKKNSVLKGFSAFVRRELCIIVKVRSIQEHSCAILSSIKTMIIFNNKSAEIKTKSDDILLKIIIILIDLEDHATVFLK